MGLRTVATETEKPVTANQESMPERMLEDVPLPKEPETPASTEVVVPKPVAPPAVVAPVSPAIPSIASLKNKYDPEEIGSVKFPRLKARGGNINDGLTKFGEFVDIQVLSHHDRWFVVPGKHPSDKKQDDSSNVLCRASYDGKNIKDRETGGLTPIEDYLDDLRGQGWTDAKVSKYCDIMAIVFNSDKEKAKAIALNLVQISVAPTSIDGFIGFYKQAKLMVLRGQLPATHQACVRVNAVAVSNKKGDYTKTEFSPVPLDILKTYTPVVDEE